MKVKQICMMVLLWLGVIPAVQAQTFDKLWKEVEQAEKKSLPKTVIKLTDEIYQKGEKEKNSPQMLKAYAWRMKYREMLNPDSLYAGLKGLEQCYFAFSDSRNLCKLCCQQPVATSPTDGNCRPNAFCGYTRVDRQYVCRKSADKCERSLG